MRVPSIRVASGVLDPDLRLGRVVASGTKAQVTLRLDVDVVDKFRASGDGWQTRINEVLKSWVQSHA